VEYLHHKSLYLIFQANYFHDEFTIQKLRQKSRSEKKCVSKVKMKKKIPQEYSVIQLVFNFSTELFNVLEKLNTTIYGASIPRTQQLRILILF